MKDLLWIGTYTEPILFGTGEVLQGKGKGIHLYAFHRETETFEDLGLAAESRNPSFVHASRDGQSLYAVNELKEYEGRAAGGVSAFHITPEGDLPRLTFLGSCCTGGTDPCHVTGNRANTHIYVANFMSGSVSAYPVAEGGALGPASQFIQHQGSSVDPKRQAGPHAHSVVLTPEEHFALVPDLGLDKLMVYRTDFEKGTLTAAPNPHFQLSPGEGPRFCEFHPNGRVCYLINELASSLSVLHYDGDGGFTRQQVISTIPQNYDGSGNICADVHVTGDGAYVYASNRGHNSIAVFSTGEGDLLTLVEIVPCGGKTPRNFTVSPCGGYLWVANQDSDNLVCFAIHPATGKLTQKSEIFAPTPVCVRPAVPAHTHDD